MRSWVCHTAGQASGQLCLVSMERVKGIEPSYEAWEAAVLPLNYTRVSLILALQEGLICLPMSYHPHD